MLGSLSKGNGDGNEDGKKKQWILIGKTTTLLVHHAFLYMYILYRHCTTTTWKCLISRFMEDVNKRTRNLLSHSELGYGSGEFNSRRVRLHLAKPAQFKRPAFHAPKFKASWVDPSDISSTVESDVELVELYSFSRWTAVYNAYHWK